MLHTFAISDTSAGVGFAAFIAAIIIIVIAVVVFEILMLISVIRNRNVSDEVRLLWILGMLLFDPIIAIVYYFTDHKKTSV